MKLLAFAASTSSTSLNRIVVEHAVEVLRDEIVANLDVEVIDLQDFAMPIYQADLQREHGILEPAHRFYELIGAADAVLISFAEHNGHYTAAYKNLFDWTSRIDRRVYQDTSAVLFSTSPGPRGGRTVLQAAVAAGPFFGYDVLASLSIPSFHENFDDGRLVGPELVGPFRDALSTLGTITPAAP